MMKEMKAVNPVTEISPAKKVTLAAGALVLVFMLGYIPSCVSARIAEGRAARLEFLSKMNDLLSQAGMASYEANRNNFASAAEYSGHFFTSLAGFINESQDQSLKQKLQPVLALRDEITTNLAQADAVVKPKLAQIYADLFHTIRQEQSKEDL
jgi:hypothetical protein